MAAQFFAGDSIGCGSGRCSVLPIFDCLAARHQSGQAKETQSGNFSAVGGRVFRPKSEYMYARIRLLHALNQSEKLRLREESNRLSCTRPCFCMNLRRRRRRSELLRNRICVDCFSKALKTELGVLMARRLRLPVCRQPTRCHSPVKQTTMPTSLRRMRAYWAKMSRGSNKVTAHPE
jgi:hypothetical protein